MTRFDSIIIISIDHNGISLQEVKKILSINVSSFETFFCPRQVGYYSSAFAFNYMPT